MDSVFSIKNGARFHVPHRLGPGAETDLPDVAAHHAMRVLRLAESDPVIVFDGTGGEYEAVIVRMTRSHVRVKTLRFRDGGPESPVQVTLLQGVSGSDRMDFTLRKAVELGVHRVVPLFTERSVVKLDVDKVDKRRAHWQGIVISACEQCGRNHVPEVAEPVGFRPWLAEVAIQPPIGETRLLMAIGSEMRFADLPRPTGQILLLAGPEGGFSPVESELARSRGFTPIRLGPRVLRTETAAIAALSAIQTLWGDF
ncbi:MAG: 16S rRNA (uracil(1498)-N(3))-methyltransferase [Burkholderiales bacterium]